ncbi:hypothetical protein DFH27DRAFT_533104 [Peziza echinospora]|nr:hypothetical protein DFH27DRAFT_533104 [Peziza echinospora]
MICERLSRCLYFVILIHFIKISKAENIVVAREQLYMSQAKLEVDVSRRQTISRFEFCHIGSRTYLGSLNLPRIYTLPSS